MTPHEERLDELELRQKQLLQNFTDTVNAIAAVREIKNLDQALDAQPLTRPVT